MKKPTGNVALLLIGACVMCGWGYYFVNEKDIKCRRKLRPVISLVDTFITENGRCPHYVEFGRLAKHDGFILIHNTDHVRSLGGPDTTDYILGYWRSDWYYCYRSWDGKYYDDYNNDILQE